jgi:hypothetical protein
MKPKITRREKKEEEKNRRDVAIMETNLVSLLSLLDWPSAGLSEVPDLQVLRATRDKIRAVIAKIDRIDFVRYFVHRHDLLLAPVPNVQEFIFVEADRDEPFAAWIELNTTDLAH